MFNRRNAFLGWLVLHVARRRLRRAATRGRALRALGGVAAVAALAGAAVAAARRLRRLPGPAS